jgi:hypothetical protein
VIRQDDLVIRLVVHYSVKTWAHFDLLNNRQGFEVEHRDVLIAAVRREAVTGCGGDASAVYAWRVRNVAEDFAGRSFNTIMCVPRDTNTRPVMVSTAT